MTPEVEAFFRGVTVTAGVLGMLCIFLASRVRQLKADRAWWRALRIRGSEKDPERVARWRHTHRPSADGSMQIGLELVTDEPVPDDLALANLDPAELHHLVESIAEQGGPVAAVVEKSERERALEAHVVRVAVLQAEVVRLAALRRVAEHSEQEAARAWARVRELEAERACGGAP